MSDVTPEHLTETLGLTPDKAKEIAELMQAQSAKRTVLALRILIESRRHVEAAAVLSAHMTATCNANVAGAYIMCWSYALELLLKALIVLDNEDASYSSELNSADQEKLRGHHLPTLFDRITPQHQSRLAKIFSRITGGHVLTAAELRRTIVENAEKNFVDWRYLYEQPGLRNMNVRTTVMLMRSGEDLVSQLKTGKPTEAKARGI